MMKINKISNWVLPSEAFNWIHSNIEEGSTILELGSGFGSIALSMNYNVVSIEQNKEWIGLSDRVKYIYAPIVNKFYKKPSLLKIPKKYDLLIVDGPTKASGGRLGLLDHLDSFYLDCPILIDDLHREDELSLISKLSDKLDRTYEVFDCGNKKFGIIK